MTSHFPVNSHILTPKKKIIIKIFYLCAGQIFFKVKITTKGPRCHK